MTVAKIALPLTFSNSGLYLLHIIIYFLETRRAFITPWKKKPGACIIKSALKVLITLWSVLKIARKHRAKDLMRLIGDVCFEDRVVRRNEKREQFIPNWENRTLLEQLKTVCCIIYVTVLLSWEHEKCNKRRRSSIAAQANKQWNCLAKKMLHNPKQQMNNENAHRSLIHDEILHKARRR